VPRCIEVLGLNETVCATVAPVVCGGQTCASGETCCQTTGACVAAGSNACPTRSTTYPYIPNARSCGSNADCGPLEFCAPDDPYRCIANSGHCHPINNCGYCGPVGDPRCQVCGCNGVTYESVQASCVAGATYVHSGPCGGNAPVVTDIACGRNDQCPSGAQCCFRTGNCFPSSEPWRCEPQPDGSILNCSSDSECNRGTGGSGGSDSFCGGDTCGASPGRCLGRGSVSNCGGEVRTVCGCDGTTYVNDCWARVGGTRVAHSGACP
jgi:hypothetical protein